MGLNHVFFGKKKRGGSRHAQTTKGGWRILLRVVRFLSGRHNPVLPHGIEESLGFEHFRVLLFPNNLKKSTTF